MKITALFTILFRFVSLPHYNGRNQVCSHISKTGKPTPPFPYSVDYSASAQAVAKSGTGNYFNGLISRLAVFKRALSESELKKLIFF